MPSPEPLIARIRSEYREMPGLRLTFAQACRLWQLDAAACASVLDSLLTEKFLTRTPTGHFVALPTPHQPRVVPPKTALERVPASLSQMRRPA
jgi:hypothetical protein